MIDTAAAGALPSFSSVLVAGPALFSLPLLSGLPYRAETSPALTEQAAPNGKESPLPAAFGTSHEDAAVSCKKLKTM